MADRVPSLQARDKLAFLLSLVPWLMDHDGATVTEAAEHFGMTPEQIREAVRLIAVSGVPGETDSYQHEDLFDIDWDAFEERDEIQLTHLVAIDDAPRFSAREAAALIAGLQYLASLPENAGSATLAGLTGKLSAGASAAPAAVGASADPAIASALALIREAVERGVQLDLVYLNASGEKERRNVDPLRVESFDDDWYLRGWCHLRGAVRTFRLDRISETRITDLPIEHRASEVRLPDRLFEPSPQDLEVTIDIEPSAMPLIADFIPDGATTEQEGDRVRTTLRVSHYHGLKRLATRMSGVMTVVGPDSAREAIVAWARAGADRYREASR
ncbi:helix-turn-helix transcriptional regulator [Pseudolysinimonas sp.]|uniref:helix-turn-helix transcriptional regulator n=1 Tax=Pseudolysinimonas sp. TaxID=2680009 RepID=UPI003F7FE786